MDRLGHHTAALRAALLALLVLLAPSRAWSAGLSVMPVSLEFAPDDSMQGLWLSNRSERPLTAQLRAFAWDQQGEEEHLQPTRALLPSPPLFTLAPGQQQYVRIVRADIAPRGVERSFRLLVDELPDAGSQARPGLQFVMRYVLPVFVDSPPGLPALTWQLTHSSDSALLTVDNDGGRRAQLSALRLTDADGGVLYEKPGLLGYALASRQRQWRLPLTASQAAAVRAFTVNIDGHPAHGALATAPPAPGAR